jgi:hypothetical protein
MIFKNRESMLLSGSKLMRKLALSAGAFKGLSASILDKAERA